MRLATQLGNGGGILVLGVALLVAGCTASDEKPPQSQSTFYMKDAYDRLNKHFADCSQQYGYTRESAQALGPYQVPRNELQWRDCAYAGIRSIILPETKHPELYTALIEKDKIMTAQVGARRMTRAQRRAQLDINVGEIRERERAEMLRARPGVDRSAERDQQLQRQAMDHINIVMGPLR